MMKKVDKKKIILSVLLSSMLWSNSLYAYELTGEIAEEDLINNGKFVVINIDDYKDDYKNVYTTKDSKDKITIKNKAHVSAHISNIEAVENSEVSSVYGGYSYNTNNNEIEISNSEIFNHVAGGAYGESNNYNTLTIENSEIETNVFGGGYGSDNNFNKITLINTIANSDGGVVAGGYYIHDGKITDTDRVNVKENEVNVIRRDIENEVDKINADINYLYGGYVDNSNRVIKNINVKGNNVKIDNLGKSSDNSEVVSEVVNYIIGGRINGTVYSSNKYMPDEVKWNSSNNNVEIKNSFIKLNTGNIYSVKNIMGGGITGKITGITKTFNGTVTANNRLDIIDSYVVAGGGYQEVNGGYVSEISDNFTGFTSADNNIVTIDNSTITGLISGGRNDRGQANNNVISIGENSFVNGRVIGGWSEFGSANNNIANNNIIEINGYNNLISSSLYGYYAEEKSENSEFKNNTLIVNDFNGGINEVANFNKVTFNNLKWNTAAVLENNEVDILGTKIPEFKTDGGMYVEIIDNVDTIEIGKLGNNNLKTGDKAWLIFTPKNNNNNNEIRKFDGLKFKNYSGVAKIVSGNLLYKSDVELTGSNGSGTTQPQTVGALSAVVTGVERNKQVDLVASNRAVAAAFVNQGTDLIADSLDTLSRDGKYGVKTFAAVHGNRSKYDVNSDIKINGWSTIVGVGAENEHNGGDFSWGVFYENGSGNYRTYNDFNNEFFRGDGSLVYNGGGIAARYENSHGVYTEGSLRAGMLKSEMTDALSDGENKYGYESETAYYGAHIGVGKIFSLGDDSDLDVYGKFFHTYTEGDSFNVADDEFEFDSINSDRLRIGARVTSNKENKFSTYYGLAYEYEFNGDAEMRAAGMKAPTQSLQGSSVMAEIGLNYQPTPDSPWSFDLNMRGYAGERQGGSFNVQATYTF